MFLLVAHAFFKALLFLGAGIVIHALSGEQDVRRMGGLQPALRRTTTLMWIGTIGLIGFWPLAKDAILASALAKGGTTATIVWVGGLIGAFFTGVYATRLMRLTFYGRRSTYADVHLHDTSHGEAPWTMFWTVAALAAGTILVGLPRDRVRHEGSARELASVRRADRRVERLGRGHDDGARMGRRPRRRGPGVVGLLAA